MFSLTSGQVFVSEDVILDGRLALFHGKQRWLAVADLHFGFELSQRAAGNLFPLWGMRTIEQRLLDLLADFQPARLVMLGDLVHDNAGAEQLFALVRRLEAECEVVLIAGNHDRHIKRSAARDRELMTSWQSGQFYFHHGNCSNENMADCIQIIGHHHPAAVLRDGAGLRLKLPAFVQQERCWILPAFSPWAAGAEWPGDDGDKVWACSPQRVLKMSEHSAAASSQ